MTQDPPRHILQRVALDRWLRRAQPRQATPPQTVVGDVPAARPLASAQALAGRHRVPFVTFGVIGAAVFAAGLGLQVLLVEVWHLSPVVSYVVLGAAAIQASFLLNRRFTWRDRDAPFWVACYRFNVQKIVTTILNFLMYIGLISLGVNYLVANVLTTAAFTLANYALGHSWSFADGRGSTAEPPAHTPAPLPAGSTPASPLPTVSAIVPCRGNEATIRATVESLLAQDYPVLTEIILVGSTSDTTWRGLHGITDPRLIILEVVPEPDLCDPNVKRDRGIRHSNGQLVALVDSDIVMPRCWVSRAVASMYSSEVPCVAGGMKSIHDSFWGRYVDGTRLGAKTPRVPVPYLVTRESFGRWSNKPPITANVLLTRELYEQCPLDVSWSYGYEDYEWFWRIARAGYRVLFSNQLDGRHHHRRGLVRLAREYLRSAEGCARLIATHPDCPLARKRALQATLITFAAITAAVLAGFSIAHGHAVYPLGGVAALAACGVAWEYRKQKTLESLAHPFITGILAAIYIFGIFRGLAKQLSLTCARRIRSAVRLRQAGRHRAPKPQPVQVVPAATQSAIDVPGGYSENPDLAHLTPLNTQAATEAGDPALPVDSLQVLRAPRQPSWGSRVRAQFPVSLFAILAVQAALSLSLVWSNTAFGDEANYLWLGHLDWSHWLHGTQIPPFIPPTLSGSAVIYPPIGAMADSVAHLAGARILSLCFMMAATALIYWATTRLDSKRAGLFAAGVWVVSAPTLRLAFATYDALSVSLTALAIWCAVQAAFSRHRGKFVAATAVSIALANATAYSGIVIDPALAGFAFLVWSLRMSLRKALACTAWLVAGWLVTFWIAMSPGGSWTGLVTTVLARPTVTDRQSVSLILQTSWREAGLIIVLAAAGAVLACTSAVRRREKALLLLLACASLLVAVGQIHEQTAWALDKHLAYSELFGAIAAGYALSRMLKLTKPARRGIYAAAVAAILFAFPAIGGIEEAWSNYHDWPNAKVFISAFRPLAAKTNGNLFVSSAESIPEYYTPQGHDWVRWGGCNISLNPHIPQSRWPQFYTSGLHHGNCGLVCLFYNTLAPGLTVRGPRAGDQLRLLGFETEHSSPFMSGLTALTVAVESDHQYRIVATGPLNSSYSSGLYVIWQKRGDAR